MVIVNIRSSTLLGIFFKDRSNNDNYYYNDNNYYYNGNFFLSWKIISTVLVHPY